MVWKCACVLWLGEYNNSLSLVENVVSSFVAVDAHCATLRCLLSGPTPSKWATIEPNNWATTHTHTERDTHTHVCT